MTERFNTRLAVFMILRNDKNEILLQQRSGTAYLNGYWDLPSGHVEYGEALRDAAVRELLEEAGVTARPEDLQLVNIDQYFLDQDYVNFTFVVQSWQGTPSICEPDKCSDMGWFAPDALPEKCVNAVRANEQSGFGASGELSYFVTNKENYTTLMGEPFPNM
jgi:mutator protein MutT